MTAPNEMDAQEMRHRIKTAMVARLATVGADGRPHIVPITFAPADGTLYFAVDHKPKRTTNLQRLRNIEANPAVTVLVDHYEDDWSRLWWVRVDGTARIVEASPDFEEAISLLTARYEQYRSNRPAGPVVEIKVERMTGWSAS
jgi:PPOX class probable F420-dependent enzyme